MASTKTVLNLAETSMNITKTFFDIAIALESEKDYTDFDCINEFEKISKDIACLKASVDYQIKCAKSHK